MGVFFIDVQWYLQGPNGTKSPLPKHACQTIEKGYVSYQTSINIKPRKGPSYTISYGDPVTRMDQNGTISILRRGK